jgi:hypothetical protein
VKHEDRRKNRRGRQPADLDLRVPPGGNGDLHGPPGVETGLVSTPAWWPFTYTTKDNLKRLKRQRAVIKVKQWVSWPEALF